MEEKLLEIIYKHSHQEFDDVKGNSAIAKEIADHFKEFIEWICFDSDVFCMTEGQWKSFGDKDGNKTLDELYTKWLTNIYKK